MAKQIQDAKKERVRIVCDEDLCKGFWIEYDVSRWNFGVFYVLHKQMSVNQIVTEFIPQYTTAWHIRNQDGTVIAHPGIDASEEAWVAVWNQFDVPTTRAIFSWLWLSTLLAWSEAQALESKRTSDDSGDSSGPQDASDGPSG